MNEKDIIRMQRLLNDFIKVLDKKARNGCTDKDKTWVGFQNVNGTEVGIDFENII